MARRTTEGRTKRDIIGCLERLPAREIYHVLGTPADDAASTPQAA
jgi:hypothetical protein